MKFLRLKLYHFPATRSARVKWLLHELLDEDFDVEVVGLYDGVQYSAEYLAKNPNHNVPALEITLENGESRMMLESGAMVAMLADIFPDRQLAPPADTFSPERADYLQMLHFGTSTMDMMLWQIRIHTHMLGRDSDPKTIERYQHKFTSEVEPQLISRLQRHGHICGDAFTAADCVMGQNVSWARAYGLCEDDAFSGYLKRLSARPAFQQAYADLENFTLAPTREQGMRMAGKFTG